MPNPDDIVGHKTFRDGDGYRHEPLSRREAEEIHARVEANLAKRKALMPDEKSAISMLFDSYDRLRELGWREAIYCPKDGTHFQVIEAGSTGVFDGYYDGEWPNGHWWICEDHDLHPSRPILFRLYPEDQAKEDARKAEAMARFKNETKD